MSRDSGGDVADAIRAIAAGVRAPQRLRLAIDEQPARRPARGRVLAALCAAGAAAVAAVAVAVLASGGAEQRPPTIGDTAAVALLQPALPPPVPAAGDRSFLRASSGGVRFPDYAAGGLGWRAEGLRRARRGGRDVVVVSYAHRSGARAGYAIVAGPALQIAAGARTVVREHARYAVIDAGGTTIVTWRRGGRTCVLASRRASAEALLEMAAWRPGEGSAERY